MVRVAFFVKAVLGVNIVVVAVVVVVVVVEVVVALRAPCFIRVFFLAIAT